MMKKATKGAPANLRQSTQVKKQKRTKRIDQSKTMSEEHCRSNSSRKRHLKCVVPTAEIKNSKSVESLKSARHPYQINIEATDSTLPSTNL